MNFFFSFLVGLLLLSHFVSPPVAYCQYEALPCSDSSFYCEAETTLQGTGITLSQLVQTGIPNACTNINNQNPVCPAGTSFRKEWCMCLPCYPGTYQPLAGQTTCLQTSPGRYAAGIGNLASVPCGINTYSLGGNGLCTTCPEGTFFNQTGATSVSTCQSTIFQGSLSGLAYGPMTMPGLNFGSYQLGFGVTGLPVTILGASTTLTPANVNQNIVVNNSITLVSGVQQSIPITVTLPSPSSVSVGSQLHIFARNGMWRNAQNQFHMVTPNTTATVVSNLPGSCKTSATQLVYEAGSLGADGVTTVTSRRVLFPSGSLSFGSLNAIGQSLLLASLNYTSGIFAGGGQMLYINIAASLSATEVANIAWMTSYGWNVTTRRNTVVSGTDLVGKNLVFIGTGSLPTLLSAIVQGSVPILFVDSRAAVAINVVSAQLTSANIILDDVVDPIGNLAYGIFVSSSNTNGVTIFNGSHPLANGLVTGQTYDLVDPIVSIQGAMLAFNGASTCPVSGLTVSPDGNTAGISLVSDGSQWRVQLNRNWVSSDPTTSACIQATSPPSIAQQVLTPQPLAALASRLKKIPDISQNAPTTTPIKHVVIVIQENKVFDQVFGTYPHARNDPGDIPFVTKLSTPTPNGFTTSLLNNNPNILNPTRVGPLENVQVYGAQAALSNSYEVSWNAFHHGLMDRFALTQPIPAFGGNASMSYFDGNTITAYWNYAQAFGMSDNCFHSSNTASTPGYLNWISGSTSTALDINNNPMQLAQTASGLVVWNGTVLGSIRSQYEFATTGTPSVDHMSGLNIGDMLNAKNVTWGYFGGAYYAPNGTQGITSRGTLTGMFQTDPFAYWQTTRNVNHTRPTSPQTVGYPDPANHNYDVNDLFSALDAGNMPAVSYIRLDAVTNGHPAGASSASMEQAGLIAFMNRLQTYPQWNNTVVFTAYDDWGGFYDHVPPPVVMTSQCPLDTRDTRGSIFTSPFTIGQAGSTPPVLGHQCRASYGFRNPFMAFGPWVKENYVDHTQIDTTSTLRFIEDNWSLGRIGGESLDQFAGDLSGLFDFSTPKPKMRYLFLKPDGSIDLDAHV